MNYRSIEMREKPEFPLKVFFNGSCPVCSKEMSAYMGKDHGGRLEFIDISDPGFCPREYGMNLEDFMYQMHAIDRRGDVYRGVDAFRALWSAFPGSRWYGVLRTLTGLPLVRPLACLVYRTFTRLRRCLPKRRAKSCRIGRYPPTPSLQTRLGPDTRGKDEESIS